MSCYRLSENCHCENSSLEQLQCEDHSLAASLTITERLPEELCCLFGSKPGTSSYGIHLPTKLYSEVKAKKADRYSHFYTKWAEQLYASVPPVMAHLAKLGTLASSDVQALRQLSQAERTDIHQNNYLSAYTMAKWISMLKQNYEVSGGFWNKTINVYLIFKIISFSTQYPAQCLKGQKLHRWLWSAGQKGVITEMSLENSL